MDEDNERVGSVASDGNAAKRREEVTRVLTFHSVSVGSNDYQRFMVAVIGRTS